MDFIDIEEMAIIFIKIEQREKLTDYERSQVLYYFHQIRNEVSPMLQEAFESVIEGRKLLAIQRNEIMWHIEKCRGVSLPTKKETIKIRALLSNESKNYDKMFAAGDVDVIIELTKKNESMERIRREIIQKYEKREGQDDK